MLGMETALQMNDQHLFDLLDLPSGIDKDDVVDNIMLEGSEFEVVYPEPSLMRSAIGLWGRKHYRTFSKWITALNIEYNPLENYDRQESWGDHSQTDNDNTRTFDNQDKRTIDTENKRTIDTENKRTIDTEDKETIDTENKRTLDTEDKETRDTEDKTIYDKTTTETTEVSAFDSSAYQPSQQLTTDETGDVTIEGTGTDTFEHTGTDTMENSGTDTFTHSGTDTMENSGTDTMANSGTDTVDYSGTVKDENDVEVTSNHTGRIHGNIGVTTSQQMLQSELDIARFNIVQQITDLFLLDFCIMIYD